MCAHNLHAQGDMCQTVGNIIKSVSTEWNGTIYGTRINWNIPAPETLPTNANGYIIYEYKGGAECTQEINRIYDINVVTYFHNGITLKGYSMAIGTTEDPGPITQQHAQPVITDIDFDPCTYEAEIRWTPYVGWGNEHTEYAVLVDVGNTGTYTVLAEQLSAASYLWRNAPTREALSFMVKAVDKRDNTAVSYSKPEAAFFDFPRIPRYMFMRELQDNNSNYSLSFEIDPATEVTAFEVQRALEDGDFSVVHNFSDKTLSNHTDAAGAGLFRYRIAAKNACGNIVYTSNEIVNIQMKIVQNGNSWQLQWKHAELIPSTILYSLDRQQPNPANLLLNSAATTYSDPIVINSSENSLQFCYIISGMIWEEIDTGWPLAIAVTKSGNCVYCKPSITMPDAIDPLSTIVNPQTGRARNQFGPVINAHPQTYSYRLTILNRNGAVVADIVKNSGDNPLDKSWNGCLRNSDRSPEEVYTYHLSVTFEGGEQHVMTGTVAVVYSK